MYLFLAYKDEKRYPYKCFHKKIFKDFNRMKNHSANHSYKYKEKYPNYISTYFKIEI